MRALFLEDVNLYFPPVAFRANESFTFGRRGHDKGANAKKFHLAFEFTGSGVGWGNGG